MLSLGCVGAQIGWLLRVSGFARGRGGRDELDLEDGGPLLAGDEEAVVLGVVGDAVENGFGAEVDDVGEEAGEVDPGDDVAVAGRDAGDAVGVPDVGVDLAVDVLEFVE